MELRRRILSLAGLLAASLGSCVPAFGQAVVTRVTGPQPWRAANADSDGAWSPERNGMAISADNRWVVFESGASNLAPCDRNRYGDLFVFEVATGRIVEITSNKNFTANGASCDPAISGDGRWVVFVSNASNLVAYDLNGASDVFLIDRDPDGDGIFDEQPCTFERVSIDSSGNPSHGSCMSPCVSDDGYRVLYLSDAFDLVDNDNNFATDAFLYDRAYGTTERVDVDPNGDEANDGCSFADLSPDGSLVVYCSDSDNLVPFDTNLLPDVFLHDLGTGATELVSADPGGYPGDAQSYVFRHCLSADGRFVAFQSFADNLTTDTNGGSDDFLRDRWSGSTALVSVDSNGNQGNGNSVQPTLSADGSRITFVSTANNLAAGDSNGNGDVFLRDSSSGTTTLLSASTNGGSSNGWSGAATISADGSKVVLSSDASDLVATGDVAGFRDVFLRDLSAGTIRYVSALQAGDPNGPSMLATDDRSAFDYPVLSADARHVAFESDATNLVDGDGNGNEDVFVADRSTGSIVRISVSSSGAEGNGRSWHPAISATGRFIAFASEATNLIASDANGAAGDVFLRDRDPDGNGIFDEGNATTTLVSVASSGNQGNGASDSPSISADGTRIAFTSAATNFVFWDPIANTDIYERDTSTGETLNLSGSSRDKDWCDRPSMSSDGSAVSYTQYHFDAWGDLSQTVSEIAPALGGYLDIADTDRGGYPAAFSPCNSVNGTRVALSYYNPFFGTPTSQIGVCDPLTDRGCYLNGFAGFAVPAMNPTGLQVTFHTTSSLSSNDANTTNDVYLFDVEQSEYGFPSYFSDSILVSRSTTGAAGNADSMVGTPSEDGNLVVFASDASDLVAGDTNGCRDVFLFDRTTTARCLNYGSGFAGNHPIPGFTSDSAPVLGSTITLSFGNSSGVPVTALVFLSLNDANLGLPWGATLLVDLSTALRFLVPLGAQGGAVSGTVPNDAALAGVSVYLQALEYDAAVSHKLSFTPGLELRFGY